MGSSDTAVVVGNDALTGRTATGRSHPVRRVAGAAFWVFVLGMIAVAVALVGVPLAAGAQALIVKSGSMQPTLPVGSVAVVHPQPVQEIQQGAIITFADGDAGGRLVTHRVVAVRDGPEGLRFATKGDANEDPDPGFVPAEDVRGVLWYQVPWVGAVRDFVTSAAGVMYGAALALLVLAGHLLLPETTRRRGQVDDAD